MKSLIAFMLLLSASGCSSFASVKCSLVEEGADVTITGVLQRKTFLGPPGFGETPEQDQKTPALLLKVEVINKKNKAISNEIQIHAFSGAEDLDRLAGKTVTVSGRVWHASMPTDFTPFVIDISEYAYAPSKQQACILIK